MLMSKILSFYETLGLKEIIIYNFHHSSSNSFYKKFGAKVFKTQFQLKEQILTDVFKCDIITMKDSMNGSILKYSI